MKKKLYYFHDDKRYKLNQEWEDFKNGDFTSENDDIPTLEVMQARISNPTQHTTNARLNSHDKMNIIKLITQGKKISQISRELQVSRASIYRFLQLYMVS